MLTRSSKLILQGCRELRTPLFVPSFSSSGFESRSNYSEVQELYRFASPHLGDVSLVSAYDVAHGHLTWDDIRTNHSELLVIDSGGYEAADKNSLGWSEDQLTKVLGDRPSTVPAVYVSYDSPFVDESIEVQIERATKFKRAFSGVDVDILLRAGCKTQFLKIASIKPLVSALSPFAIVGVTEKDLGASTRERMLAIRELRAVLDDAQIFAPIHVFGSLSPVTSILYFLMGAEIFDGLSWLRNYFIGQHVHHILESYEHSSDIELNILELRKKRMLSNLDFLESLSLRASEFAFTGDWSLLPNGELCREIASSIHGGL